MSPKYVRRRKNTGNVGIRPTFGIVCVGLLAIMLRKIGQELPFLRCTSTETIEFGYGGSDEWMYVYRDELEPFDTSQAYPRGTLLLRVFNEMDQGHVAILAHDAPENGVLDTHVLHMAGSPVGVDEVTYDKETVSDQHLFYEHLFYEKHPADIEPYTPQWGTEKRFTVH